MEIEKTSNEAIGKRIQTLREEKGMTQMQFAVALGTSNRENIARWEAGTREIKVGMLAKISEILNVSADYLLGLSDVKSTEQDMKIACEVIELSEKAALNIKKITSEFFHKEATKIFESNAFYWAMFHLSSALSYAKSASDYADLSEMNDENLKPFTVNRQRDEEIKNMRVCLLDVYEKTKTLSENYFKKCLKERANNAQHNPEEE